MPPLCPIRSFLSIVSGRSTSASTVTPGRGRGEIRSGNLNPLTRHSDAEARAGGRVLIVFFFSFSFYPQYDRKEHLREYESRGAGGGVLMARRKGASGGGRDGGLVEAGVGDGEDSDEGAEDGWGGEGEGGLLAMESADEVAEWVRGVMTASDNPSVTRCYRVVARVSWY